MWQDILNKILEKTNQNVFERWFSSVKLISMDDQKIELGVPNLFYKDWLEDKYISVIKKSVTDVTGSHLNIVFAITPDSVGISRNRAATQTIGSPTETPAVLPQKVLPKSIPAGLNPRYTFDAFVVGSSNRFAHAAALAVAESPMKAYNPLFIYGGVGLGKTHLMHAIGQFISLRNPEIKIAFVTSEKFTNELISSIQNRKTIDFRNKYRNVDVLMIDDIHFIAGKESTQEEFHHTFNTLYDAHKQIIISSDRPPKDIPTLEERLVSRFEWGLVTDIQAPDLETRIAILKKKLETYPEAHLSDEVIYFLANVIKANIRELEGALIRLISYNHLIKQEMTLELTREILKSSIMSEDKPIQIEDIQKLVAEYFDLRIYDIKSDKRMKTIVFPRHVAMYLCRQMTTRSLPEIGDYFGGRDHSTVIHACDSIKTKIKNDESVRQLINTLTKRLRK